MKTEPVFVNLLRSPGIDSQPGRLVRQHFLTYRHARLHRLADSIPWNRFMGSLNVYKFGIRMLLDYAAKCGGVVVSRDNYRDLIGVSTAAGTVIIHVGQELHRRQEQC